MNFKIKFTQVQWCCDQKYWAASAQSFTLWQQATIEITCHDHSIIACLRHMYSMCVLFFAHIRFWSIAHFQPQGCNSGPDGKAQWAICGL